ncbi:hypothetical protein CR513_19459, partial [Mucuna pruriens]
MAMEECLAIVIRRILETESSPTLSHPKLSQSDSIASNSALSQDRIKFLFIKIDSDQSFPRASRQSTLDSTNNFAESEQMENNDRTLKELDTLDVVYQPWCIQYP